MANDQRRAIELSRETAFPAGVLVRQALAYERTLGLERFVIQVIGFFVESVVIQVDFGAAK